MLVVWHLSLPLMNNFKKKDVAFFPMQAVLFSDYIFFMVDVRVMFVY